MYLPRHHEETELPVLHALIRAHPLGAWVTHGDAGLSANHIPFLLDTTRGAHGTLLAHVARANPVWREVSTASDSLVIFQGADAYITPSWYASKQAHGKAVPTWNYAVVHAHGRPRVIEDRDWLRRHVAEMSDHHEAGQPVPWQLADAPSDFIERLLELIVGIEIPLTQLVGKWKVSQNRPDADKLGVVAGLRSRGDTAAQEMADWVQRHVADTASD